MSTNFDPTTVSFATLLADQQNRLLGFEFVDDVEPQKPFLINQMHLTEGMSRDFVCTIGVLSADSDLEFKAVLGKSATVSLRRKDGSFRYINGNVFDVSYEKQVGQLFFYSFVLRPTLAFLDEDLDCRVFANQSVNQLTASVLNAYSGLDWRLRARECLDQPRNRMQYNESSYNFLHRHWLGAGLTYCYEHFKDGNQLNISDDFVGCKIDGHSDEIPFQTEDGANRNDTIRKWRARRRLVPTRVSESNFSVRLGRAENSVRETHQRQGGVPAIERHFHSGTDTFRSGEMSVEKLGHRVDAINAGAKTFEAVSDCRFAMPGRYFKLTKHFNATRRDSQSGKKKNDPSIDRDRNGNEMLILEVEHNASNNYFGSTGDEGGYENSFVACRRHVPWVPPENFNCTPTKMLGTQVAIVAGRNDDEIYTNDKGEICIYFPWDRDKTLWEWVRVVTSSAGRYFGHIAIPRVGLEVLVTWLESEPDRPIVTGCMYNGVSKQPWTLPENKTQSGMVGRSTPNGDMSSSNTFRFEDKNGSEEIWLHAQKDHKTEVRNDETRWVGRDRTTTIEKDDSRVVQRDAVDTVKRDQHTIVENSRFQRIDKTENMEIGGNRSERVGASENVTIAQNREYSVGANETDHIGQHWSMNVGKTKTETIGAASMESVGVAKVMNIGVGYDINVGMVMMTVVGCNRYDKTGKGTFISAGERIELSCGNSKLVFTPNDLYMEAKNIHIKGGENVHIDGEQYVNVNCKKAKIAPDGSGAGVAAERGEEGGCFGGDPAAAAQKVGPSEMLARLGDAAGKASKLVGIAGQLGVGGLGRAGQVLGGMAGLSGMVGDMMPGAAADGAGSAGNGESGGLPYSSEEAEQDMAREANRGGLSDPLAEPSASTVFASNGIISDVYNPYLGAEIGTPKPPGADDEARYNQAVAAFSASPSKLGAGIMLDDFGNPITIGAYDGASMLESQGMLGNTRLIPQTQDFGSAIILDQRLGGIGSLETTAEVKRLMMDGQARNDPGFTKAISDQMGIFARINGGLTLADGPGEVVRVYALPQSETYAELHAMLDPVTHNLADGVTKDDFYAKAQGLGLKMMVQESGITNSGLQSYSNGMALAKEREGKGEPTLVLNAYNATQGATRDIIESAYEKFGMDTAPVIGTRIAITEAMAYNYYFGEKTTTEVWGHSEGSIIVNKAIQGIDKELRNVLDLRNFGVATGTVPSGLNTYIGVANVNDSVYQSSGKGMTFTGGIMNSGNFAEANKQHPGSYQFTETDFKVAKDGQPVPGEANHSWQYYMVDPATRQAFGLPPLSVDLQAYYSRSAWIHGE